MNKGMNTFRLAPVEIICKTEYNMRRVFLKPLLITSFVLLKPGVDFAQSKNESPDFKN